MNEELTPLEALERLTKIHNHDEFKECYNIVENALKEYELMKNAKIIVPNKKISEDDFEKLRNQRMFVGNLEQCEIKPLFDEETIKKLKALDLIREKPYLLENVFASDSYIEYVRSYVGDFYYTPKQYELLKEVLKND